MDEDLEVEMAKARRTTSQKIELIRKRRSVMKRGEGGEKTDAGLL